MRGAYIAEMIIGLTVSEQSVYYRRALRSNARTPIGPQVCICTLASGCKENNMAYKFPFLLYATSEAVTTQCDCT